MPTDFGFRLSTYLSLGLACLCLGYSEWDLLPEVTGFTAGVMVLLVVSFWMEGRYAFNLTQANRMGAGIFVLAGGWLAYHYFSKGGLIHTLPWPAGLLPYLGPLLMVLMPAKLFRPKHVGDWWAMQGIGLVAVGLACTITDDAVFAGLLTAYVVVMVWSAALFFHRRWAGTVPPVPGYASDSPPMVVAVEGDTSPWQRHLKSVAKWTVAAVVISLPAFFVTPRSPSQKWQLKTKAETGYSGESVVDLSTTGVLQVNREVAFEVFATRSDGFPKTDLSGDSRWRGDSFMNYDAGKWTGPTREHAMFPVTAPRQPRLADLGQNEFTLDYKPAPSLARPVLLDPVAWAIGQPTPAASEVAGRFSPWDQFPDGSFVPKNRSFDHLTVAQRKVDPYRQVEAFGPEPDLGPGYEFTRAETEPRRITEAEALGPLLALPTNLTGVKEWSDGLLSDLIRRGKLSADVATMDRITQRQTVRETHFEAVARAFRDYFVTSREFRYDLDLKWQDKSLDPIEDFLRNTRSGHCQRFASALALSLRAVGVPSAFVHGFKGSENDGEGKYTVRQEHAHAWVAVLVPKPTPPKYPSLTFTDGLVLPPPTRLWHWLSLDPTPGVEEIIKSQEETEGWYVTAKNAGQIFYSEFIIGYDLERRNKVVGGVREHLSGNGFTYIGIAFGLAGLIAGAMAVRRFTRRSTASPSDRGTGVAWYDELVAILAEHGHPVRPGQTPGEHATETAAALRADPRTASVAVIPADVATALYEVRYAGRPLTAERESELASTVVRLANALSAVPRLEVARA